MAGTQTTSVRSTTVINGSNQYEIVTTCNVAGTLPDRGIFLLAINEVEDPKDDTLERVIEVADISEYLTDRDDAITAGQGFWRSASVTLRFSDIETANAAWKELESRISTLVDQVDAFNDEFETSGTGDVTVYPTVDLSEITARKDAYTATLEPITEAEEARDEKQLECTQLETDLATVEDRLQEAEADLAIYLQVQASTTTVSGALPTISTNIANASAQARTLVTASGASASEISDINAQLSLIDNNVDSLNTQSAALTAVVTGTIASTVSTLQARVSSLTSERNSIRTQLNECSVEIAELQAAVTAARTARDDALAAVIEVCPDFTP